MDCAFLRYFALESPDVTAFLNEVDYVPRVFAGLRCVERIMRIYFDRPALGRALAFSFATATLAAAPMLAGLIAMRRVFILLTMVRAGLGEVRYNPASQAASDSIRIVA